MGAWPAWVSISLAVHLHFIGPNLCCRVNSCQSPRPWNPPNPIPIPIPRMYPLECVRACNLIRRSCHKNEMHNVMCKDKQSVLAGPRMLPITLSTPHM